MPDYIDLYCERTSPEFWNEPFNALTNVFFLIAAFYGYKLWKNNTKNSHTLVLIALAACVGVGSFLFHTFATYWSLLTDVIPITLFIFLSLFIFLYERTPLSTKNSVIIVVAFAVFNVYFGGFFPDNFLNGSIEYAPALLLLVGFAIYSYKKELSCGKDFALASGVFVTSLTFRSIDNEICHLDPTGTGTHFLWHTLNGLLLYLVIRGLVRK